MLAVMKTLNRNPIALFGGTLLLLLLAYIPLLQRIPNGADHYFMIDVGETQIVLNTWGTLHATGYPHYVILGNLLTAPLRWVGLSPAVAAAVVSVLWGMLAAGLLFLLAYHLGRHALLAALVTLAYGLTRTVWVHHTIAEIYTFGLVLLLGLLTLALWGGSVGGWRGSPYARIYWLALLGGVAVAHHRALVMVIPALLFAVWGELTATPRRLPGVLIKALGLGLIGFVPYAYLMLRARMGAAWVYGEPGTLPGLWDEFIGTEAARFIGPPSSWAGLLENIGMVNGVLFTDLMLPGVLLGGAGLAVGMRSAGWRRAAITMTLSGAVAYLFHVVYYTDILSALILPVTLSLVFGWLFGALALLNHTWSAGQPLVRGHRRLSLAGVVLIGVGWAAVMGGRNVPFIRALVTDPAGLAVIEQVRTAPPGSVIMLPWGPLHFAVGYALDVTGDLNGITLIDHKTDYTAAADAGRLITPAFVRHRYPLDWWTERIGSRVYPQAAGPGLVTIHTEPQLVADMPVPINALASQEKISCEPSHIQLQVMWLAPAAPARDLSVFVHLLDADGNRIAQDDRFAPVYGWRPVTTWTPGELILDWYTLPRLPSADRLRYGLYYQGFNGEFVNVVENEIEVGCDA